MTATRRTLTILLAYLLLVALAVAVALPAAADEVPPGVSVDAPTEGQTINTPNVVISGTATDDVAVERVRVRIQHDGTGEYWTGISWISTEAWLPADLTAPDTTATDWSIDLEQTAVFDDSPPRQGGFTVTARAEDTNDPVANTTTSDPRAFTITDNTAPVITLFGDNPLSLEAPGPYVEPGASADDDFDDIAGEAIQIVSNVNASVPGSYEVTYDVSDSSGNAATQVVRTVDVDDTTAPVITLLGANPQFVEQGGTYVEAGATAVDALDGDVTGDLIINSASVDTSTLGNYFVSYRVTDDAGNMATKLRTVSVVEDATPPVITLLGDNPQEITLGAPYIELGATATDNVDGDLTDQIDIDASDVDTSKAGTYEVEYSVSDSTGNPAMETRTVEVVSDVDSTPPVITLEGASPQLIGLLSPYTELGAKATDDRDGDISGSIVIDASAVDTSTAGTYQVTYDVMDAAGNAAVQKVRTVEVVDFFTDDDGIFERVINAIAAAGITRGCNPPANDEYCPNDNVTRGQFSALLARALGYTDRADDPFTDDDSSIFEADIEKLAYKNVLRGCNPPTNDRVCPDSKLTRGAAAAMFVRALGLTDNGGGDLFDDDDNSVFEDDIDKLATAGITLGCNPPANTNFCPEENITRAQIAAFFARAFDL